MYITIQQARGESTVSAVGTMHPKHWLDCKMKRDVKRRKFVKAYAPTRVRLVSMKRNDILPIEIRVREAILPHFLFFMF